AGTGAAAPDLGGGAAGSATAAGGAAGRAGTHRPRLAVSVHAGDAAAWPGRDARQRLRPEGVRRATGGPRRRGNSLADQPGQPALAAGLVVPVAGPRPRCRGAVSPFRGEG